MESEKKRIVDLSWSDIYTMADAAARSIVNENYRSHYRVFGIPRGGVYAAQAVQSRLEAHKQIRASLVEDPKDADVWVDDILASGATKSRYEKDHGQKPFYALVTADNQEEWFVFPWERMKKEDGPEDNVRRILEYLGEDTTRDGLLETPQRVVRSWGKIFGGYKQNPKDIFKVFQGEACDQLVVLRDIEFYSCCEHHMQPFFGKAHIGYLPKDNRVLGVSKLARLLEIYARRLQIQERIGTQVTEALMNLLQPLGCGCMLEAQHFCITSRGVEKQDAMMVTSSMRGCFMEQEVRNEFLRMIGK